LERPLNLLIGDSLALLPRCALPRVAPLTPHCPATLANLSCRFGPHPAGARTNWIRSAISATSAELSCLLCPINLFCVFLEFVSSSNGRGSTAANAASMSVASTATSCSPVGSAIDARRFACSCCTCSRRFAGGCYAWNVTTELPRRDPACGSLDSRQVTLIIKEKRQQHKNALAKHK
jgi:hypothetical protein